jgi:hypothetical protein
MDGAAAVPSAAFNEPVMATEPFFKKSPVPPAAVVHERTPDTFVDKTWPFVPVPEGNVNVYDAPTGFATLTTEPALFSFSVSTFADDAVMSAAVKFPEPSRLTIVPAVLTAVAAFAASSAE